MLPGPEPSSFWTDGSFCLKAGWLIDGFGTPAVRDRFIHVHEGAITKVTVAPAEGLSWDRLIDCSHATILPLLSDAHVHLSLSGTTSAQERKVQLTFEHDAVFNQVARHLKDAWRNGIGAVREAGDHHGLVHELLYGARPESLPPVDAALTRWGWHAPGRYGAMIAKQPDDVENILEDAEPDFPVIDHVKIIQSGINSIDTFGYQGPPQFSEAALSRLTASAHSRNIKVMVHANGVEAVRIAIAAGCDSIEHGYFMGMENLRQMAERGIVWVPTVIPMAVLTTLDMLSPKQRVVAEKTVAHQKNQVAQAMALGVTIGLGTDAGSIGVHHGSAVLQELEILIECGMTVEQAIQSATSHNAGLMGRPLNGGIAEGFCADFIVVPACYAGLINSMRSPLCICRKGKWYQMD